MKLTKAGLIKQLYVQHEGLTKAQSTEAVDAILRITKATLVGGSDLLLSGFGRFHVRDKRPRRGRNPQTGEDLMLDSRRVVTFKPSVLLRDKLNNDS